MRINHLQVKNFRNITKIDYYPIPNLNILIGNNAQGKTNILEAIYVLSGNSSFRTSSDNDLLNYNSISYNLRSKYLKQDRNIDIFLSYDNKSGKVIKINNKKTNRKHADLLKIVLFTPDDLYLVKGSPAKRRNFIDFILKQVNTDYINCLDNFNKLLKKRNLFLKSNQTNTRSFNIINDLFIEYASKLILSRLNYIYLFDEIAGLIFKEINDEQNYLKIRYALSFPVNNVKINFDNISNALAKQLYDKKEEEIRKMSTIAGPHLDDLHIYLDNRQAKVFASQGQQRNIVIAMKLAELETFKKIMGFYPLFLLDEVLSELDRNKKNLLINRLIQAQFQSFLTSVNIDNLDLKDSKIDYVVNGKLVRKE